MATISNAKMHGGQLVRIRNTRKASGEGVNPKLPTTGPGASATHMWNKPQKEVAKQNA